MISDLKQIDDDEFERERLTFVARRSAMLQVCSNPAAFDPSYSEIPAKLAVTRAVVSQRVDEGEKVVVWSFFTESLEALVRELAPFNPVRYDGTVGSAEERRKAVAAFQGDEQTKVFVANPAAAGAGLTLTAARCAVYESFSNQAAHHLQSLDRIHRRGQQRPVDYIVLLCSGTIEIAEYERLLRKEREARDLLADHVVERVTRLTLLEELLAPGPADQPLVA